MDQSLDEYVKEHKITGRGGGRGRGSGRGRGADRGRGRGRGGGRGRGAGRSNTSSFYNQGTGGGAKREGPKKGLIPDRTVSTRGGSRGRGQSRGRGRGGTGRIQKRTTPQNQGQSQSQQAAKKRLLQAKKTLQLAIQEATKVTRMTGGNGKFPAARGRGKANRSTFGSNRTTQRHDFNSRYLDRLDAAPRQSHRGAKQSNSKSSFYNTGSNSDRVVSTRGRRGTSRGRGRGKRT